MSESEDTPILHPESEAPKAIPRPEESPEWVIEVYRRQMLQEVSDELDSILGEGREADRFIEPILLDNNPVRFRQSLHEQVFPTPREITENLLDVSPTKVFLEAPSGMGKSTFLKVYQERMLKAETPEEYPVPVICDLSRLPDGTGFEQFYPMFYRVVMDVVLREQEEQEDLIINEELLGRTVERLVWTGQILFLLDGFEQMLPEDRFRFYMDVIVDGDALKDNFILIATRPVGFGPLATTSIVRRGQDASFRVRIQPVEEKQRKHFLPESMWKRNLGHLALYFPETLQVPYVLHMVKEAASDEAAEVKSRSQVYRHWITQHLKSRFPKKGEEWIEDVFRQLEQVSYRLIKEGRNQRQETVNTGFDKALLSDCAPARNVMVEEGDVLPGLDGLLAWNHKRWEFRHPSLQEYFSGRKLAELPDWRDLVKERCRDPKWYDVFQFFGGELKEGADELIDLFIEHGAVFLAGQVLPEIEGVSESRRLLVNQLLKYQCRETYPQFAKNRVVRVEQVMEACGADYLWPMLKRLLQRDRRDSRILFGVLELVCALHGIALGELVDSQEWDRVRALPELESFFAEATDPQTVDRGVVQKWGECVTVPAGSFIYQDERDDEDRIGMHEYAIMKYPVTNSLFRQFDPNFVPRFPAYSQDDDQPAIGINYYEATVFALWLGMRLPTEKEWEKASRGPNGRDYPWGEAHGYQEGYCNTADFVVGHTTPVTQYEEGSSPYGCYDMAGNVWEWCVQFYASKFTTQKIVRGGSWLNYMVQAKCTFRNSFDPADIYPAVGFRCTSLPFTEIDADDEEDD
ncbi:SUMF1/EgtB/PvdO family nonheme iron enzyme [Nitrospina gracilis]|uniref:SUMF1/EgtB/PvdO family nonheme iron enzyme n=1 Tax=Nitrospina gracilis TaxID=35801 RepID=UPI001F2C56CD|nr:SUMF1/EgtB/PvdO family nonheme iron enzyme [Nitrospina gracilis]MCF8720310.1 formylglycine-generating enzyme required for sulfatase activity [Nitrospina gracilis Nb-211]